MGNLLKSKTKLDRKMIVFCNPDNEGNINNRGKTMNCMMLKNALYRDIYEQDTTIEYGSSLIHFHLKTIEKKNTDYYINFNNFLYLLEEFSQYNQDCLDRNHKFLNDIFIQVLKKQPEELNDIQEIQLPRKHNTIGLLMIFLDFSMDKLPKSDGIPESMPFFNLLTLILNKKKEKNEDKFIDEFEKEFLSLEKFYSTNFKVPNIYDRKNNKILHKFHFYEKFSSWFSLILLYAAIKTKQKKIIDKLFEFNNFLICELEFPPNMIVDEIHQYTVHKFLECKYELARSNFPRTWITYDVMKKFLDSRITIQDNYLKVDFRFLLPYFSYDDNVDSNEYADEKELLNVFDEDFQTAKYILDDSILKPLLTHPIMEIFIRVKFQKYMWLYIFHFICFILFYIIPSVWFSCLNHNCGLSCISLKLSMTSFIYITIITTLIRSITIQYYDSISMSDIFDRSLIFLSFCIFLMTLLHKLYGIQHQMTLLIFEALNVILMTIGTTFFLPFFNFPIYMKSFRIVLSRLINIAIVFMPLVMTCVLLLFIHFDKSFGPENEDFLTLNSTFYKYTMMYFSGVTIEKIDTLNVARWIIAVLVIVFTVSQTNLIMSMIIDDIQNLMKQSKKYILTVLAEKYTNIAQIILNLDENDFR